MEKNVVAEGVGAPKESEGNLMAAKFLEANQTMELAQWESAASNHSNGLGFVLEYRPVKFAAGVFQPKGCFQDVRAGKEDFDQLYCYGNSLIMILSFVNIVLFAFVLVFHVKAYKRTMDCLQLLTKIKTFILLGIVLLEMSVFARYTFNIDNQAAYDAMLICSGFLESIILFQICHFYTKKAAHFLSDGQRIQGLMRKVLYLTIAVFTGLALYQFWDENVTTVGRSGLCHSIYFILPNLVNQVVNAFFIYIGCRIMKTINEINSQQAGLISLNPANTSSASSSTVTNPLTQSFVGQATSTSQEDMHSSDELSTSKNEREFRRRASRNMWVIIVTISAVVTYSSLYSIVLYAWADSECYVQESVPIRNLSTVTQRSMQFIWWLYPVLWLFWPKEFSCRKPLTSQVQDSASTASQGTRSRIGQKRLERGEEGYEGGESSDEGSSYAGTSSASYINLSQQNAASAMFGGPSCNTTQQSFMLLPNAAHHTPRHYAGPSFYSTSEVDLTSLNSANHQSTSSRGCAHISAHSKSNNHRSGGRWGRRRKNKTNEFSLVTPNSDVVSPDFDRDF